MQIDNRCMLYLQADGINQAMQSRVTPVHE